MRMFLIMWLISFVALAGAGQNIRPFSTDGCTMSPEGTLSDPQLWHSCCVAHDLRFWGGGTKQQRDSADRQLKACVREKAGTTIANIFFTGVRIGQLAPWKIPSKRWGNAWPGQRPYRKLSEAEIYLLLGQVTDLDIPLEMRLTYQAELEARPSLEP